MRLKTSIIFSAIAFLGRRPAVFGLPETAGTQGPVFDTLSDTGL